MGNEVALETEAEAPPERGPGRPPVVTLPLVEKVAQVTAKGVTEEQACVRVGVNHSSLRTARHRKADFETAIKRAQAENLDESLDLIGKGARDRQGQTAVLHHLPGCHSIS